MKYIIMFYWIIIVYLLLTKYVSIGESVICLGLMLIAMIIEGWREYDSKTKFRE
jgi:hypothetical protein